MGRYFAVDLGAESGRCIAGTLENGIIQLDELWRFPTQGLKIRGEWKWNVYRFYEEILKGLRIYADQYGPKLDSIGVDTWGVDFGLLDKNGTLMGIPYTYRDKRTEGTDALLEPRKKMLYRKTGIQFLEFNTLNQLIAARKQKDTQLDHARELLFVGDILHYLLGAKPVCEYTAASISMMVDTVNRKWDDEIFEAYNIPVELQSQISFAGDKVGTLRDDIADQAGLKRGIPIITPAVHDTASAVVATPAEGENFAFISSGTWSLAGMELKQPVNNEKSFALNISNSGGVLGKSLFLKNIMGLWIIQQCKKQWNRKDPGLDYSRIVEEAKKAPQFMAFIDVDDNSFFAPDNMPQAIVEYLKKTNQIHLKEDDIGAISRLIYEGLALKYRYVLGKIEDAAEKKIDVVHVTGGGGKNTLLNQFIANALHKKVTSGPEECTATGNLLMQAYGCGHASSLTEIRRIVRDSFQVREYVPEDEAEWNLAYKNFSKYCF